MILRDYQRNASDAVFKEWLSADSTLVVLPTGTGKTVVFADVIRRIYPRRAMVLAHRQELIWQAKDKIERVTGLGVGVEMGDHRSMEMGGLFEKSPVIISTIQTHAAGGDGGGRMGKFDPSEFGVLIVDEAHHSTSASYVRAIEYYRTNGKLKVLGVTATPDRADEAALGQVYETVAFDYEIVNAVNDGWLVPIEQQMVQVGGLDFSCVKSVGGDLSGNDLDKIMTQEKNLHGVAGPAIEIIKSRRALVFTSSVKHAELMANIFNRHRPGMAKWVCAKTPPDERTRINKEFDRGDIQVLCNCGTHTEGYDSAGVEVVVMARPTESRSLYAQMAGRATRPLPGTVDGISVPALRRANIKRSAKPSCLIIDFVGNSGKHKLVTTADILGGNVSDEAVEFAKTEAVKRGKPVRMDKVMEEEEKRRREETERRRIEEESRKHKVTMKVAYSAKAVSPFDVFAISPVKEKGWHSGKVLSEKQANVLRRAGVNPDTLSYAHARQLLNEMFRRFDEKLCTFGQAKILKKYGLTTEVSFQDASSAITKIAQNGWKIPNDINIATAEAHAKAIAATKAKGEYLADKVRAAGKAAAPVEDDDIPF